MRQPPPVSAISTLSSGVAEVQTQGYQLPVCPASHVQAKRGRSRPKVGPSPVDRARPGSKHHVSDGNGLPLGVSLTGANRHDITQLSPLVDGLPPVRGKRGPRQRPTKIYADRGYDIYRRQLHEQNITPKTASRGQAHGSGLGRIRWVAESAIAHLHGPRRLRPRWEARDDTHDAFLQLAQCMILARRLPAF